MKSNIDLALSNLIYYHQQNNIITNDDTVYFFNKLLEKLALPSGQLHSPTIENIEEILDAIALFAIRNNLIDDYNETIDNFKTQLMDIFLPAPSFVIKTFNELYKTSPKKATDYFYDLMIKTNYIRKYSIQKNLSWETNTKYGKIGITINLSKPEKDPRTIALALKQQTNKYPKCMLCQENIGYAGRIDHPSRANLRFIPITLNNEEWFIQYSPYSYYDEHCIAFSKQHKPMVINETTFKEMIDFVDEFPHYFIGSNADLPIVGGSILTHHHFQGGLPQFPLFKANSLETITLQNATVEYLNWPLDTIKIEAKNKDDLITLSTKILNTWRNYTDKEIEIISKTDNEHNTITPICIKRENYEMYLMLRNNRTTSKFPYGIFHPSEDLHHIKKENIGLIEAMGLAILPGRLKQELELCKQYILNNTDPGHHKTWLDSLENKEPTNDYLYQEVSKVFQKVLESCSVFKYSKNKQEEFKKLIAKSDL